MKFSTKAIHLGQDPDPATGAVITPIYQTTTFAQEAPGVNKGYDYTRSGNPTRTALETVLASMEGGKHGYAFSSGLGALTTLVMSLLKAGDHIIVCNDAYGGTNRFFEKVIKKFDVKAVYIDMTDPKNITEAVTDQTRMIFMETPTNPLLRLVDLEESIKVAKDHNLIVAVDNTFATPYIPVSYTHLTLPTMCVV